MIIENTFLNIVVHLDAYELISFKLSTVLDITKV